ncbi:hypothetical protein OC834_003311, partial [Tilletia horrida]
MQRAQAVPETQFSQDEDALDWYSPASSSLLAREPALPIYGSGTPAAAGVHAAEASGTAEQLRVELDKMEASNASIRAQLDRMIEASIVDRRRIRQQDHRLLELDDEREALARKLDLLHRSKKQAFTALAKCIHEANSRLSRLRHRERQVEDLQSQVTQLSQLSQHSQSSQQPRESQQSDVASQQPVSARIARMRRTGRAPGPIVSGAAIERMRTLVEGPASQPRPAIQGELKSRFWHRYYDAMVNEMLDRKTSRNLQLRVDLFRRNRRVFDLERQNANMLSRLQPLQESFDLLQDQVEILVTERNDLRRQLGAYSVRRRPGWWTKHSSSVPDLPPLPATTPTWSSSTPSPAWRTPSDLMHASSSTPATISQEEATALRVELRQAQLEVSILSKLLDDRAEREKGE